MLPGMTYQVQTPVFEGPFDLLLHLILRDEVDLYSVSLIEIVDAFLAELARMDACDLENATEFLLIAATLLELKSRRLLPDDSDLDLDEEFALWEERDLLLARLLECKTFKDAAVALEVIALDAARSYPRTAGLDEEFIGLVPDLMAGVTAEDLRRALMRALAPRPTPRVDLHHVTPIRITVADTVRSLAEELPLRGRISFSSLTSSLVDRIEVVVHFLAVLELYKQGRVDLEQIDTFSTITIEASTRTPIEIAIPPSDMMFAPRPCIFITMKEMRIETGIEKIATSAERKWKRKTMQTSATMIDSSIRVWVRVSIARWINAVRSYAMPISTSSGSPCFSSASFAFTRSIVSRVSAPERTTTTPPTVSPSPFHSARPRRISGPIVTVATSRSRTGVPPGPTPRTTSSRSSTSRT